MTGEGPASARSSADSPQGGPSEDLERPANLKHELRTPLNHIIGYCEMLIEQAQDEELGIFVSDLDRIHLAGTRLLVFVDDLCDPEASQRIDQAMMHHEVRTPLNQVIGYAEMLEEQAKERGQDVFAADAEKIHTAGRHLLALIVKSFTDPRWDSGPLGSASVPRRQAFAKESSLKQRNIPAAATESASLLVVDDDKLNRDMLMRRLKRLGYNVSCAENGSEALKQIKAENFDLLLLDVVMPVMDGFAVLEQLEAEHLLREIPVIVLSASDQIDHVVRCIRLGAMDYIGKPFNPVLLQARIGSCLERKRLRDRETSYLQQIEQEKKRSDDLLHVILPRDIAAELKDTQAVKPRRFEKVAVLFCDVVGFTSYSDRHSPEEILMHLQSLMEAFEQLCAEYGLEKIKTIGDEFMAAAGLSAPLENPTLHCIQCGLAMAAVAQEQPAHWQVRVGVNVGSVIAGVVGRRKYQYDIWGDTVNTADRMQEAAEVGSVCVNDQTWSAIAEHCCGRSMGRINIKGKGEQELFLVEGLREGRSADTMPTG